MTTSHPFDLELPQGRTIHGIVDLPEQPGPRPAVVICHGFKGFQEWGFFPALAELLAERGFTAIRFNFTGSGMRPGDELVTDLAGFRSGTVGRDLEELGAVIGAAGYRIANGRVDRHKLGLFGFSRGGGCALLAAASEALNDEIRALVTWSGVGTFDRLSTADKKIWHEQGEIPIVNGRTGQEMMLGIEVLREVEEQPDTFDLQAAAARRQAPWLIVHGGDDETVPVDEARNLAAAAAGPCRLQILPAAGHTLGAAHPFAGPTPLLIEALNLTQSWFREYLPPGRLATPSFRN